MTTYMPPDLVERLLITNKFSNEALGVAAAAIVLVAAYRSGSTPAEVLQDIAGRISFPREEWEGHVLEELRYILSPSELGDEH